MAWSPCFIHKHHTHETSLRELQVLHQHVPLRPVHGHVRHGELLHQRRVRREHEVVAVQGRRLVREWLVGREGQLRLGGRVHRVREARVVEAAATAAVGGRGVLEGRGRAEWGREHLKGVGRVGGEGGGGGGIVRGDGSGGGRGGDAVGLGLLFRGARGGGDALIAQRAYVLWDGLGVDAVGGLAERLLPCVKRLETQAAHRGVQGFFLLGEEVRVVVKDFLDLLPDQVDLIAQGSRPQLVEEVDEGLPLEILVCVPHEFLQSPGRVG